MSLPVNFGKFFQPSYLFDFRPTIDRGTVIFLLSFFAAIIVAAFIVKIYQRVKKHDHYVVTLLDKYFSWLLTSGLVGMLLVWFRYETAALLSARFWLVAWVIMFAVWLIYILKYQFKIVPHAKEQSEQKKIFNKYLPRKK